MKNVEKSKEKLKEKSIKFSIESRKRLEYFNKSPDYFTYDKRRAL